MRKENDKNRIAEMISRGTDPYMIIKVEKEPFAYVVIVTSREGSPLLTLVRMQEDLHGRSGAVLFCLSEVCPEFEKQYYTGAVMNGQFIRESFSAMDGDPPDSILEIINTYLKNVVKSA